MKIEQEPKFQPITLVLETKQEAEMFWKIVREHSPQGPVGIRFCRELSDWFSEKAQL